SPIRYGRVRGPPLDWQIPPGYCTVDQRARAPRAGRARAGPAGPADWHASAPQLRQDPACGRQAGLDRPVHADSVPSLGDVRTGEIQSRGRVVEVVPAVGELSRFDRCPGGARPAVGDPVVSLALDHLQVGAPLL